jgi:hypothetical protein
MVHKTRVKLWLTFHMLNRLTHTPEAWWAGFGSDGETRWSGVIVTAIGTATDEQ